MRILILLISLAFTHTVTANTLKLNYSLFFGYMKTMYKLDLQHVTTAFYLVDPSSNGVCEINKVEAVVDEQRDPIEFEKNGRLFPFYSNEHRKDGAMIEVETVAHKACALQVTLMAKKATLNNISFGKLALITTELEAVLHKNAGMIGKYFLPSYEGLRFKLANPIKQTTLPVGYSLAKNGDLLISNDAIKSAKSSQILAYKAVRITPWIGK